MSKDAFALELGYRGNTRNNEALINRYERNSKQIPLTVASLAYLTGLYYELTGKLPEYPDWEGYELELVPGHIDEPQTSE